MKQAVTILVAASLTGCASLPSSEPPRYDHAQQTLIAPGYPVERVRTPPGFEFADLYEESRRQDHDSPTDHGSARVEELGVVWVKRTGQTGVATVLHQAASQGSYWLPWRGSDGYEFIGDRRFQYQVQSGGYDDVSGDAASTPRAAPECAINANMVTYSRDRQKRSVFTYTEGRGCDQLAAFGQRDAEALRQRAYQAFGLR